MNAKWTTILYWTGALFMAALLAFSLPQGAAADDIDPPGRVARLGYAQGAVSFQPAGESEWIPAAFNRPITTGDTLWTDDRARAELQLGATTIRMSDRTGMSFLNLDDRATQIQLTQGTISIRVLRLDRDEDIEVDTPNQAFSILREGQYRVQASEDGTSTLVIVRDGMGEVTGGGRTYSVGSGLAGNFTGTDSLYADIYKADSSDEFDNWSQERDHLYDQSRSAHYVSRDLVGYEDLDENGSWRSDPEYGDVWVPRVSAGWAPYRDGHWAWISPWGWTWIDDASWGFAPFHYGRWVYSRNNWSWVPGPAAVRPVYAPALVVFVGGPSFGLSLSFGGSRGGGNVGWFPLGPREVYVPGYNASREYVTRVNVSNTVVNNTTVINVYNNQVRSDERGNNRGNRNNSEIRYANRAAPGGVTVVTHATFTGAQPVGRAMVAVNQREIESAPVSRRAEVAPTRTSVYGTSAPVGTRVPRPSEEVVNRSVVAKRTPPPPPVSFERQQQRLAAQPGQPLARTEVEGLRPSNAPAVQSHVRQAPPGRPATAESNQPSRQLGNVQPATQPPPSIGANPSVNNPAPVRNDRPNGPNRGQPGIISPSNLPPASAGTNPPVNNIPPARDERSNGANRGEPVKAMPPVPPPSSVGTTPPMNSIPPARTERPNGANRGPAENVPPSTPPAANVGANPTTNDVPPARNERGNGPNRGQPASLPPVNPPPASLGATPPMNSVPPARTERPNGANRGPANNVPPPTPPAANLGPNPPGNNAAPARNDRGNGPNRGQPANPQPVTPPPASVGSNPPVNNAVPARNDRSGGPNRGQTVDKPANVPEPSKPANNQVNSRPKDQPAKQGNDKKDGEKQKKDDQPPQR